MSAAALRASPCWSRQQAQEMQRLVSVWIFRQRRLVRRGGSFKLAAAMERNRLAQVDFHDGCPPVTAGSSYCGMDLPSKCLSNQLRMCSSRSTRCQGFPDRDSS